MAPGKSFIFHDTFCGRRFIEMRLDNYVRTILDMGSIDDVAPDLKRMIISRAPQNVYLCSHVAKHGPPTREYQRVADLAHDTLATLLPADRLISCDTLPPACS